MELFRAGAARASRAAHVFRRLSRGRRAQTALPDPAGGRCRHRRGNDLRSHPDQREDRSAKVRDSEMKTVLVALCLAAARASNAFTQPAATATLRVTVVDSSNAIIVGATVTATGAEPATRAPSV